MSKRRLPQLSCDPKSDGFHAGILQATRLAVTVRRLADLRPVFANDAALDMFGYPDIEQWKRVEPSEAYSIASLDLYFAQARPSLLRDGEWSGELSVCTITGQPLTAFCHIAVIGDCTDESACIVNSFQDITLLRQAETRRESSERRYRQLFHEMLSGYALFRLVPMPAGVMGGVLPEDELGELECVEINPAFEWITGLEGSRILGRTLSQALGGERSNLAEFVWRVGATGMPDRCERYFPEFDRYLEVGAFSPDPAHVAMTCNDVTDLMEAKDRYRSANHELETMFANSLVGILLLDGQRRVMRNNQRVEEILGYGPGELLGRNTSQLFPDLERFEEFGREYYEQLRERQVVQIEYQLMTKDGQPVWCRLYGKALPPGNTSQGVLWVVDDITQLKRAEKESVKAKNQFLANMSHEIRTPLNGVLGMLQLLLETRLGKEQRELAATALGSGKSLLTVLNDILDFSKVEAGKIELHNRPFDLSTMLETVFATFRADASSRGLDLRLEVADDRGEAGKSIPPLLLGDEGRLRQVLLNLVGNAVKFTNKGFVSLCVEPLKTDGGNLIVRFEVRDSGVGIPAEKLDSIFESFTQIDGSFTRRHDGLGLGLGIVRQLTDLMGGSLDVNSVEGEGTVFEFRVPLGLVDMDPGGAEAADGAGTGQEEDRQLQVLVAEDDPVNRLLAGKLLKRLGHVPHMASSGLEVLGLLGRRKFDVILMDVQMPEMDGMETVRRIRKGQAGRNSKDIIVFAITAHAMVGDRERFLEAGMNDYIAKPVDMAVLAEKLNDVVDECCRN